MRIDSLKLTVTDADVAAMVREALPEHDKIDNLKASLTPGGVVVAGEYPTPFGLKMAFETVWQLTPAGRAVEATLATLNVAGMPAKMLRGVLLGMIRDSVADQPGVTMEGERIRIDLPEVACEYGFDVEVTVTAISLSDGTAVVEAGP